MFPSFLYSYESNNIFLSPQSLPIRQIEQFPTYNEELRTALRYPLSFNHLKLPYTRSQDLHLGGFDACTLKAAKPAPCKLMGLQGTGFSIFFRSDN